MVSRKAVVRKRLGRGTQAIPGAAHRMQQWCLESLVDLRTQATDVHVDDVRLRIEVVVPDALEQHGSGYDLALVAHQVLEQSELPRLQVDRLAGAGHRATQ